MVKPSAEVLSVSRRWLDAMIAVDRKTLRNLISAGPSLRFVGTDTGEVWAGDDVRQAIGDFFGAIPEGSWHEETFAEAFESGTVGWACFTHRVWIGDSTEPAEVRNTLVLTLEEGVWKVIQRHGSVPSPTEDAFNMKQIGISDLVAAARKGFRSDQTEGLASVLFTDIVNSAGLATAMGDRIWTRLIEDHFNQVRGIIEAASGQLVKSLGDGTMSRFSSARQALRAAARIQATLAADTDGPAFRLRIGLHTGDVVQAQGDFFGTVVNKAARVMAQAAPGEILVSDATYALTGEENEFQFSGPMEVMLKGFDGAQRVHRLEWQNSADG